MFVPTTFVLNTIPTPFVYNDKMRIGGTIVKVESTYITVEYKEGEKNVYKSFHYAKMQPLG